MPSGELKFALPKQDRCKHGQPTGRCEICVSEDKRTTTKQEESEEKKGYEPAPHGWMTRKGVADLLGKGRGTVSEKANEFRSDHPDWFHMYINSQGRPFEHYAPELIEQLWQDFGLYEPTSPGWMTPKMVGKILWRGRIVIKQKAETYRTSHPDWFHTYISDMSNKRLLEYYSPELIEQLRKDFETHEPAPPGWMTCHAVAALLKTNSSTASKKAETYRTSHPDWFCVYRSEEGVPREHYAPELVKKLRDDFALYEPAPHGWMTKGGVAEFFGKNIETISRKAEKYRVNHPNWFHEYLNKIKRLYEYYSPELIEILKKDFSEEGGPRKLEDSFNRYCEELVTPDSLAHREFKEIISIVGAAAATDILFVFHPEFRDLPIELVRSRLAEYLGEFSFARGQLWLEDEDLERIEPIFAASGSLQESFLEVVKSDCLAYINRHRREQFSQQALMEQYFEGMRARVAQMQNEVIGSLLRNAETYFQELLSLEHRRPEHVVSELKEGRKFPDINQLLNIKEIVGKQKILIADEMGLGKSASAILAKEYLGLSCALAVVPSNVIDTWKIYLSDIRDESGKQKGYFRKGFAPKVLIVEDPRDMEKMKHEAFDYVLVSHERLNDRYMEGLSALDFDMLIVDEIHKLKNIENGMRAQQIISLAGHIEGEDKYLALLSGTPVPNKVRDLAIILKLLYPEEFNKKTDKELVQGIIYGTAINLRKLLVPRMQMKSLRESIEMPNLSERIVELSLSPEEKEVYSFFIEEDEFTAPQKIQVLRKFLLNPESLDILPEMESSKANSLQEEINAALAKHDKVIVMVNGYIENILRGERNIIQHLHIPEDVSVRVIEGEVLRDERARIQENLNNTRQRMLLFVSGQTADVGVDFSGGSHLIFYNEPWTKYDKRQQLARVYREGVRRDIESVTLITTGTIEEGIHEYINIKEQAIEKLLRGIPVSELEMRLLEKDEQWEGENLEVNSELSEYFFSQWDRMMRIFSAVKEMGEKDFMKFLQTYGTEYAQGYAEIGGRSYQGNNARFTATLLEQMIQENKALKKGFRILDIASGPEMLRQHMKEEQQDTIISVDINAKHFEKSSSKQAIQGSFLQLPIKEKSMDYCNMALAFHYTENPKRSRIDDLERVKVLSEINRVLKVGGRVVLSLMYSVQFKDEMKFQEVVGMLGFRVVKEYSGMASAGTSYKANIITLEKTGEMQDVTQIMKQDRDLMNGLKLKETKERMRDSRKTVSHIRFGNRDIAIAFNKNDMQAYQEEQAIYEQGEVLRDQYGSIETIPRDVVLDNKFARLPSGKGYVLFKKTEHGGGSVIIRNKG